MHILSSSLPLAIALILFVISLGLAMGASAWFTSRLEVICDIFDLSPGLLSLLGALGANIPNYVASITAIAGGSLTVGLGVIVGSNIYNIAIILSLATLISKGHKIVLSKQETQDVIHVGRYTLYIMLATLVGAALLAIPAIFHSTTSPSSVSLLLLLATNIVTLMLFALLARHALYREPRSSIEIKQEETLQASVPYRLRIRVIGEVLLALLVALGGVVVMVQTGQDVATDIHMSPVILGLVVLAVATSLPNTVVAIILARTGRATACVEEVLSSNSINATLGIALPLLIWQSILHDLSLLWLDIPLMVLLVAGVLFSVRRQRISATLAAWLLVVYVVWVSVHLLL